MEKQEECSFWHDNAEWHEDENRWESNPTLLEVHYFNVTDSIEVKAKVMEGIAIRNDIPYNLMEDYAQHKQTLFDQEVKDIESRLEHVPAKYPNFNGGVAEDEPFQVVNFKWKKRKPSTLGDSNLSWDEYQWKHRFVPAFRVHNARYSEYLPPAIPPEQIAKDNTMIAEGIATSKYKYRAKKKGHSPCIIHTNTKIYRKR